jgi:hypothetical protein
MNKVLRHAADFQWKPERSDRFVLLPALPAFAQLSDSAQKRLQVLAFKQTFSPAEQKMS